MFQKRKGIQMPRTIRSLSRDEALVKKRREYIANTAFKLFLKKGFHATTMREISRACKLATGTIYNYIGSKSDILGIMCLVAVENERMRLQPVLEKVNTSSATEALQDGIRVLFKKYHECQDWLTFVNRQMFLFPGEYRRMLLSAQVDTEEVFKNILTKGVETGEFQVEPSMVNLISVSILGMANEWVTRSWHLRSQFTLEEYTEKYIEAILKQIRVDREPLGLELMATRLKGGN